MFVSARRTYGIKSLKVSKNWVESYEVRRVTLDLASFIGPSSPGNSVESHPSQSAMTFGRYFERYLRGDLETNVIAKVRIIVRLRKKKFESDSYLTPRAGDRPPMVLV